MMGSVVYPNIYYKYPTKYYFNDELYGSYSVDGNKCDYKNIYSNIFCKDPKVSGDVSLCRKNEVLKCTKKPYFGGDPTESFPYGLKYQDLPYFTPNFNKTGMLTLTRPKNKKCDYSMMHGY